MFSLGFNYFHKRMLCQSVKVGICSKKGNIRNLLRGLDYFDGELFGHLVMSLYSLH